MLELTFGARPRKLGGANWVTTEIGIRCRRSTAQFALALMRLLVFY